MPTSSPRGRSGDDSGPPSRLRIPVRALSGALALSFVGLVAIAIAYLATGASSVSPPWALASTIATLLIALGLRQHYTRPAPRHVLRRYSLAVAVALVLIGVGDRSSYGLALAVAGSLLAIIAAFRWSVGLASLVVAASPLVYEVVAGAQTIASTILALLVVVTSVAVAASATSSSELAEVIVIALTAYLTVAILLYISGVRAPYTEAYVARGGTVFGIVSERWRLPLAQSWVTAPTLAVLSVAIASGMIARPARAGQRLTASIAVSVAAIALIVSDGRFHLGLVILVAILGLGLLPRWARALAALASPALWLLPAWWTPVVSASGPLATMIQTFVPSRDATQLASTLSLEGRTTIWAISVDNLTRSPQPELYTGWGPDGYVTSGASAGYSFILSSAGYVSGNYPPHNALIEIWFNTGSLYTIGAVIALFWLAAVVARRTMRDPLLNPSIAAVVLAVGGLAATEVAIVPSNASPASSVLPLAVGLVVRALAEIPRDRADAHPGLSLQRDSQLGVGAIRWPRERASDR